MTSSSEMMQLSEEHELQVQGYLRFAKLKRDQHVRETLSVISDFKADRLQPGDMYNHKELLSLFKELEGQVQELVDKEIQHAYHTNALLVKMLLSQAQATGLELHVDTNQLENEFLLRTIAHSESTALSRPASDFVRRNAQLSKIGTVATVVASDPEAATREAHLSGQLQAAQERLEKLQQQTTANMRDRSALMEQINELKDELANKDKMLAEVQSSKVSMLSKMQAEFSELSTTASGAASSSHEQFKQLEGQIHELRGQLQDSRQQLAELKQQAELKDKEAAGLRDVVAGKLADAPQVKQMRDLMKKKAEEVAALKKRLAVYEPQSVPSADN